MGKENDLIIGDPDTEPITDEAEIEWTDTPPNVLADSAAYLFQIFSDVDTAIMDRSDQKKIKDIKRMSLKVAHFYMKQIYDDLPEDE